MGGTATFVSKRVFITVAHNILGADPTSNRVLFGQNIKYFIHPKYGKTDTGEFDIAIGILEHDLFDQVTAKPINVCKTESSVNLINKKTLFIGFGCNEVIYDNSHNFPVIVKYEGMGVKRYGYSPISQIENDVVSTFDPQGALSCPGDSGAPYLLINEKKEVCLLATNFISDRKMTNKGTYLLFPEIKSWFESVIADEQVEVCGLNKNCDETVISDDMLDTH